MALRHKTVTNCEIAQTLHGKVTDEPRHCDQQPQNGRSVSCRKVQSACHDIWHTGGPRQHHSSSRGWLDEWVRSIGRMRNAEERRDVWMKVCAYGTLSTTSNQWTGHGRSSTWRCHDATCLETAADCSVKWQENNNWGVLLGCLTGREICFTWCMSQLEWHSAVWKYPLSHSLNATALAASSLNPKDNSAAVPSPDRATGLHGAVLSETSPLRYVAASDLLSAAGASAGAVKAQGIQAYCCSFHVLPVPNYPLQPSDITLQLPNKQPTCSPFLCLSFFIE